MVSPLLLPSQDNFNPISLLGRSLPPSLPPPLPPPFLSFMWNGCYINQNGGGNHLQLPRASGIQPVYFSRVKSTAEVVLIVQLSEHTSQHVSLYSSVTLFAHSSPCPVRRLHLNHLSNSVLLLLNAARASLYCVHSFGVLEYLANKLLASRSKDN